MQTDEIRITEAKQGQVLRKRVHEWRWFSFDPSGDMAALTEIERQGWEVFSILPGQDLARMIVRRPLQ